jgi:hypothetical protein
MAYRSSFTNGHNEIYHQYAQSIDNQIVKPSISAKKQLKEFSEKSKRDGDKNGFFMFIQQLENKKIHDRETEEMAKLYNDKIMMDSCDIVNIKK